MVMVIPNLTYVILLAPLFGLLFNLVTYRKFSKFIAGAVAVGGVLISAICSWTLFFQLTGDPIHWTLYNWINTGLFSEAFGFSVSIGFYLDYLTGLMLITVTTVSTCVHIYSLEYMEEDEGFYRFFIYLNLFVFAMLILVLANNLLMLFIGWEGVGLCSYLLIGFWYDREKARLAGRKAFIVNRVGDVLFLIGLFILVTNYTTLNFAELASEISGEKLSILTIAGLCLFGGAVGKSAQFPLYVWLPDAMEGPTPVSSLIHAATMVTAGVYLIARMSFLYHLVPSIGIVIAIVGAITAVFAATMALVHPDMKRILAYSTISQLGYMFVAVGLGSYAAGIFHLMTHAFFKGLLFLMAGSVMHGLSGELNIFEMGGLRNSMPFTASMAVVGGLGLAGIPPIAGFWSKDEILLATLQHRDPLHWFLFLALALGALMTAFYTFRMVFVAFWGVEQKEGHECGKPMSIAMLILAIGTILGGGFTYWTELLTEAHSGSHGSAHLIVMITSVVVSFGGVGLAYAMYVQKWISGEQFSRIWSGFHSTLTNQYYVDEVYETVVVEPLRKTSRFFWKVLDDVIIDGSIRMGAFAAELSGLLVRFFQTGYIRHYLVYISGSVALILIIIGWTL